MTRFLHEGRVLEMSSGMAKRKAASRCDFGPGSKHMEYARFLTRVIDDGIAAAQKSYATDQPKLAGAIAAFESCRGKPPDALQAVLLYARGETARVVGGSLSDYWRARVYEAEVEWVCNCVSAVLLGQGKPVLVPPTARGFLKAAQVLGVATPEGKAIWT